MDKTPSQFGSWASPVSSDLIVNDTVSLGQLSFDGEDIYWIEGRPSDGGRQVLVKHTPDGNTQDITPNPYSCRSLVHEYGGSSYLVTDQTVYFSNYSDQRIYIQKQHHAPVPITIPGNFRYADGVYDHKRNRITYVLEDHSNSQENPVNSIVSIDPKIIGEVRYLVTGNDFYSSPRINPEATKLAWITWNHPNMPWDGTELWIADLTDDGSLQNSYKIPAGPSDSILEPTWSPNGVLHFVSDRTGWWNLYKFQSGRIVPIYPIDAEFTRPPWSLGMSTYGYLSSDVLITAYNQKGVWKLGKLDILGNTFEDYIIPYTEFGRGDVRIKTDLVLFQAASPTEPMSILSMNPTGDDLKKIRSSQSIQVDSACISIPETITYETSDGFPTHAFVYHPTNPLYTGLPGEKPPLLVKSHGGPTGATSIALDLSVQFWTSRGFVVLDVNYGGSTGYGRAYRERLRSNWGIRDVNDCGEGANFLAKTGVVDGNRMAIQGGSAGGYTTLACLAFTNVFQIGASYYGVSDLEDLAADTHKFESRYLDSLIGPLPESRDLYFKRSPINYINQLSCSMILFQGQEDKIVPPNQSENMFNAVKDKGYPAAYICFEKEQHGFRQADNIKRAIEAQYYFFSRVFGFDPSEEVIPIEIANL